MPLQVGLDDDRRSLLETLREHTTPEARILWEDRRGTAESVHWTTLLPLWTERTYVGGLDPEAGIEHAANGLCDALLMGKPVRDWDDEALREYCKRYNVAWVVCWSPAASERFRRWPDAEPTATLPPPAAGEPPGCLFTVRRRPSFALLGSARWLAADTRRIVLADVVPHRGETAAGKPRGQILLSLHYQAGMRVAPSRVHIEPCTIERPGWPSDTILPPFVRLWVDEPVTRATITWDRR